jgi:hypothetical protein
MKRLTAIMQKTFATPEHGLVMILPTIATLALTMVQSYPKTGIGTNEKNILRRYTLMGFNFVAPSIWDSFESISVRAESDGVSPLSQVSFPGRELPRESVTGHSEFLELESLTAPG